MTLVVVAAVGCAKKKDDKAAPEPTPGAPAPAETKPAPAPPPVEAPPVADAPKVDCGALVTADDIAKACGGAKVEVSAYPEEGKDPKIALCNRKLTEPGKAASLAMWQANVLPVDSAKAWTSIQKAKDSKMLDGVGDEAWTTEHGSTWYVGIRKGGSLFNIHGTKGKTVCTLEQAVEVAKLAIGRLP